MTTMIERVARAIEVPLAEEWPVQDIARAAIAAMREPTIEMINAGTLAPAPSRCWEAMIDAALEEK